MSTEKKVNIKELAVKTILAEAQAIEKLAEMVDDSFEQVVSLIYNSKGRVIVTGIGMKTYSVSIFDRWGKKVYESSDIKESWNGKNGDDGTYYYMIKAESLNGKKFDEKGYLLRLGNK